MSLKTGKVDLAQTRVNAAGFEGVKKQHAVNSEQPLQTQGLQARLDKIGTGELFPVVPNRTICIA